jgi:hypothetical protein
MKKYVFSTLISLIILSFSFVSCKSAPEAPAAAPAPAQQRQPTQTQATMDALNEPSSRAEAARKRAMDFEAPSYFPSEWEDIETRYTDAKSMSQSSQDSIQQAINALNGIADEYDELFKKTIPLYAQAREDEIIAAREELIRTGFASIFPDYVKNADNLALTAQEQYEAEDYYTARDTAAAALSEYETLLTGARLNTARQEVIDRGFVKYDSDNFDKADEVTKNAIALYESGDKQGAVENAEEALLRYNIVKTNGWIAYATERRVAATAQREVAILNKANIAMRDLFREADAIYTQADDELQGEKYEAAALLYADAEARFIIARQETEAKRVIAEETLRQAQEKIDESIETAMEADRIIEGGSK